MERTFNSKRENQKERYGNDLMMQREKNIRIELDSNKRYIYIYSIFFHEYLLPSIPIVDP